jgi:predicted MFS family arabinose efflux permease
MKTPVTVLMRGACPRLGRELRRSLVAGILALVVALGIGRFAYTPILPAMQERFDLSNAVAGTLASSNYLGYLLGALLAAFVPAGRARDTLLQASLLVAAVSTVLMSLTASYSLWLILRLAAGLASAGVLVLGSAVVLQELSRRGQLRLSGIFYSGPGIGIALSGLLVLPLNALLGGAPATWRADWVLLGTVALVLVVPCMTWLPGSEAAEETTGNAGNVTSGEEPETENPMPAGVKLAIVLLCLAYFLAGAGYIVTGTFLPTIVEYVPGLGGLGAGAWVLVGLAAAPSTVLWTRMAWRVGSVAALVAAYAGQATGILLPTVSDAKWAAACSALLFGGTFVGIAALTLTYAREITGERRSGLAIGLLTAAFGVGQVLGPLVAAALAGKTGGFGPALVFASAAVALGALLLPVAGLCAAHRDWRAEPEKANPV